MTEVVRRTVRSSITEEKMDYLLKEKRVIFLMGSVDFSTPASIALEIFGSDFEKDKEKPVWVVILSPGGDITSGLATYDLLKSLSEKGLPIHTVGIGLVGSIAVPLLQAGTRRFCFPNTQIVVHQASLHGLSGKEVNLIDDDLKNAMKLNSRVLDILCSRSGVEKDRLISDTKKTDFYLDAEEAKAYGPHGFVDEIITTLPF